MSNIETNFNNAISDFANKNVGFNEEAKEENYELNCKVQINVETKKTTNMNGSTTQYEATVVSLIPQDSGRQIAFYNCYVPDYVTNVDSELVFMNIRNARAFRGFIEVGSKFVPKRHIVVMTTDMFPFFKANEGQIIRIDCLPCSQHDKYDV